MKDSKVVSLLALRTQLAFLTLFVVPFTAFGCADDERPGALGQSNRPGSRPTDPCQTPNTGCKCAVPGEEIDCGTVERRSEGYVSCSLGKRTCQGGTWSECRGDRVATIAAPSGKQTLALGSSTDCIDNPCDPFCRIVVDDSTNLDLPDAGGLAADGGLVLVPNAPGTINQTSCTGLSVVPDTQTVTVTDISAAALVAEYFDRIQTSQPRIPTDWTPAITRREPDIDHGWGYAAPFSGFPADNFSVRWTGKLLPKTTETYTLSIAGDDGVRVWLNGTMIINGWWHHAETEFVSAPLSFVAGQAYDLRVEYYDAGSLASVRLRWESPSIPKSIIPSHNFGSPDGEEPSLTVTPSEPDFNATLTPAGCYAGEPPAMWGIDKLERATISESGTVNLIAAVAGPIEVTAYAGNFSASGQLDVVVDANDTRHAPTGTVAHFAKPVSGTDPAQVLYPYDGTVFPLGIKPPVLQWDTMGTAAQAVKVSLRYPATGSAVFNWSTIIAEGTPARATIPREVWRVFEQSAKGGEGVIALQRVISTTPRPEIVRRIAFSTTPVRGHIYYTQYARAGSSQIMKADPGADLPATNAFTAPENGGEWGACPVCHSVSANGNVFVTSDERWSSLSGISRIAEDGTLNPISNFVPDPARANYRVGENDWRGFAWAPLTPDGSYALAANNIWGNSRETIVGIDPATRTVSVPERMLSGGTGTGLTARYFANSNHSGAEWRRIDPFVNFDFGLGAPAGPFGSGPIGADFSVRRSGFIEAYASETYTFEVESTDAVRLIVGGVTVLNRAEGALGTTIGTVALTAGQKLPIVIEQADTNGPSVVRLRWSSPSTPRMFVPQTQLYPDERFGLDVSYFNNSTHTGSPALRRLEPNLSVNFAGAAPAPGLPIDGSSSRWEGLLQVPSVTSFQLCLDTSHETRVTFNGSLVINASAAAVGLCSGPLAVTAGARYPLRIDHKDTGGIAFFTLRYRYGAITEPVSPANLFPPSGFAIPSNGLTVSYYDTNSFNSDLAVNPGATQALTSFDPNVDFSWGLERPNYSELTNNDDWTARWTGRLIAPCEGMYEFRTNGNVDDGGRMWIDNVRVMNRWTSAPMAGAIYLSAGAHDFKFDFRELGVFATVRLEWKPSCLGGGFTIIPPANFQPTGDAGTAGYTREGGDNGNDTSYWVWRMPNASGEQPTDVTLDSPGRWGLGDTVMMVPSFAPNASRLVFVDGDSGAGAGWRKGLSTFDFDQNARIFRNRRSIVNNWPNGDVIKWPVFESDSRSIIYQAATPGDACCRNAWWPYGYMGPSNYFEDPGRLFSVDSGAAGSTPVALARLNSGERNVDANKAYQPTMLPQAVGGYRWLVFTSTRPYGNTINLPNVQQDYSNPNSYTAMLNYSEIQSQLWVSAVDDTASAAGDRSHPAFWLPQQNFSENAATGYINERAFWVLEGCKSPGDVCEVDEDCCGGADAEKTAVCRIDTPVTNPATRHCAALPPTGTCIEEGNACVTSADCCLGTVCTNGTCTQPPPVLVLGPANFERIYTAECGEGTKPVWRFFDWKSVTPEDSKIEVFAQTAEDPALFTTLGKYPDATTVPGVALVWTIKGDPDVNFNGRDVGAALEAAGARSQIYLKITLRFVPNSTQTQSPILTDWRQSYSCVPAE